jgi:hypothetical protein
MTTTEDERSIGTAIATPSDLSAEIEQHQPGDRPAHPPKLVRSTGDRRSGTRRR